MEIQNYLYFGFIYFITSWLPDLLKHMHSKADGHQKY